MIFLITLIAIGFIKKQPKKYWWHSLAAVATQSILYILFNGKGTLDNPSADGYITAIIRSATNDGEIMALYALAVVILAWGLPIYIVYKGYKKET